MSGCVCVCCGLKVAQTGEREVEGSRAHNEKRTASLAFHIGEKDQRFKVGESDKISRTKQDMRMKICPRARMTTTGRC